MTVAAASSVIATAPGKVMLAGEYAVLDGGRALVAAIDRRAIAVVDPACTQPARSEFLDAARVAITELEGARAAAGFDRLTVDTAAMRDGDRKLGLGSSAAATVAAIAAVLTADAGPDGADGGEADPDRLRFHVAMVARAAHGAAQEALGARGSGADVVVSAFGGVRDYRMLGGAEAIELAADLQLVFAWTGQPADTATLVAAVQAARARNAAPVERALRSISDAADTLAAATTAGAAIAAIAAGGDAMRALATATGVPLVPPTVDALAAALAPLGAAAKTTGAGGGDIVLVAAPASIDRNQLERAIVQAGLSPLSLAIDPRGVDIRPTGA